ncbi:MAG: hypothetical protein V4489_10520 [Chlamydiota bacterium]
MISSKSLYQGVSGGLVKFPEGEEVVRGFFDQNNLLQSFTETQKDYVVKALQGGIKDSLGMTDILGRSIQKRVKGEDPKFSTEKFRKQKKDACGAVELINAKALEVIGPFQIGKKYKVLEP